MPRTVGRHRGFFGSNIPFNRLTVLDLFVDGDDCDVSLRKVALAGRSAANSQEVD